MFLLLAQTYLGGSCTVAVWSVTSEAGFFPGLFFLEAICLGSTVLSFSMTCQQLGFQTHSPPSLLVSSATCILCIGLGNLLSFTSGNFSTLRLGSLLTSKLSNTHRENKYQYSKDFNLLHFWFNVLDTITTTDGEKRKAGVRSIRSPILPLLPENKEGDENSTQLPFPNWCQHLHFWNIAVTASMWEIVRSCWQEKWYFH